jgi:hypothetical protein
LVKRFCDQAGKPYLPLRTSSLTSLFAALTVIGRTLPAGIPTLQ